MLDLRPLPSAGSRREASASLAHGPAGAATLDHLLLGECPGSSVSASSMNVARPYDLLSRARDFGSVEIPTRPLQRSDCRAIGERFDVTLACRTPPGAVSAHGRRPPSLRGSDRSSCFDPLATHDEGAFTSCLRQRQRRGFAQPQSFAILRLYGPTEAAPTRVGRRDFEKVK